MEKINALEGIDGIQWHNWFDHPGDGACLGLRKYLDATYNGEAKPVWYVYQKQTQKKKMNILNSFYL